MHRTDVRYDQPNRIKLPSFQSFTDSIITIYPGLHEFSGQTVTCCGRITISRRIAGVKIGHSPRTPKSSEKLILFPNKNRIFLCKALHYSACRRRLDVGSRTLLSNRDFCQARAITTLHYRNRCAAEVAKDVLPMIRFSGSEVRSRQGDCSPAQRKKAIHKSRHQDIPPQARDSLPENPSRVWLAVLLLANLFIFAGIIHSIARGLLT